MKREPARITRDGPWLVVHGLGFPVRVSLAWIAAAAGLVLLAVGGGPDAALVLCPLLLATIVHEAGHAWAARRLGGSVHGVDIGLLEGQVRATGVTPSGTARFALAGPAAHALFGGLVALAGLGAQVELLAVSGGAVALHAATNLVPRVVEPGTVSDGAVLAELWFAGGPFRRAVFVMAASALTAALGAFGLVTAELPVPLGALFVVTGGVGFVAGADLARVGRR